MEKSAAWFYAHKNTIDWMDKIQTIGMLFLFFIPFLELDSVRRLDRHLLLGHFLPVGAQHSSARFLLLEKKDIFEKAI